MLQVIIRIVIIITSVLNMALIPKKSLVKYLPVTLFSSATLFVEILYFTTHKLWKVKKGQKGMTSTALSLVFGPYFAANLWAFHLTKGKFFKYSVFNIIADLIYAYPAIALFRKLNFFQLKISSFKFFLLINANAYMNFAFQKIYERLNANYTK